MTTPSFVSTKIIHECVLYTHGTKKKVDRKLAVSKLRLIA